MYTDVNIFQQIFSMIIKFTLRKILGMGEERNWDFYYSQIMSKNGNRVISFGHNNTPDVQNTKHISIW